MRTASAVMMIFLFLTACTGKVKKEVIEKYADGTPKVERQFIIHDGKKELVKEIAYFPDKKPYIEGEYKNNKRNGRWVSWYQNGKIWSEGYFKDDLNDSIRITYYENGRKRYEGHYKNGIKTGVWKFWLEDGTLAKEADMSKTPAP